MKANVPSQPSGAFIFLFLLAIILTGSCKKKEITVPFVITEPLTEVTTTTARGSGTVIDDGGGAIIARGICYSLHTSPTVNDGNASGGSGLGTFTATLKGLTPNATYYVRTYATNEAGTGYSDQLILRTMFGTVTDFDGNIYHTLRIGDQEWMAENLKVKHYSNGTIIPNRVDYAQWAQFSSGAYCWYANDYEFFGQYYGALYNGYALTNPGGLCPDGWHIPTIEEWDTMFYQLGGSSVAGGKLKSALTALFQHPYWLPPNYLGTNESGFSAFPGGFRSYFEGIFTDLGPSGYWWSATPDSSNIEGIWLSTNSGAVYHGLFDKNSGLSVRCVKN